MKYILSILLSIPLSALAVGDECINEHTPDLKNLCMAKQYANATQCDAIKSIEFRTQCISVVKNKQRDSMWAIKPINLSTADIRTETKYFNR
jgi:hypothetical protein